MKLLAIFCTIGVLTACTTPESTTQTSNSTTSSSEVSSEASVTMNSPLPNGELHVTPIEHATMVLNWLDTIFYVDPVGEVASFTDQPSPNFMLLTDIHGDHLDAEVVTALVTPATEIIAPQAVYEQLPTTLQEQTVALNNDQFRDVGNFTITAVPMYNLPESEDSRHTKGRGNGYIIQHGDNRVYISGDTADIPEMRNLEDIDIAFVCMNMPYTMDATTAADAVLDFAPKKVYPYHYRQPDGFADVAEFKRIVEAGNPQIEVIQLDWYNN